MKKIQHKKTERGSAILMTLGVLSIVMVIAMLFAATARNARTIAVAGVDDVRAAMTSESAEAFALSLLQEMTQTSATYRPDDDAGISYSDDADTTRHQPYIGNFNQDIMGFVGYATLAAGDYTQNAIVTHPDADTTTGYKAEDLDATHKENRLWYAVEKQSRFGDEFTAFAALDSNTIGFQNVASGNGADREIIGRYGFAILADGSKFNLNAIVNPLVSGEAAHSIPAVGATTKEVDLYDDGSMNLPEMPLGMSDDPNGEAGAGAFLIMGFDGDDDKTYANGETITEDATLRYGLHPQEIRANDMAYATPAGGAPRWNNILQLKDIANFKTSDVLLYSLYGGTDEPEMIYDFDKDLVVTEKMTPPVKLAKLNIQLPDLKCVGNSKLGWEGISEHFKAGDGIIDDSSDWSMKIFRQASLLGGEGSKVAFLDNDGTTVLNRHVMANMVDFCDEDDFATYLINENPAIKYSNIDADLENPSADFNKDTLAGLKEIGKIVCGNELSASVIGVMFDVSCTGGTARNGYFQTSPTPPATPQAYYLWQLLAKNKVTLTTTVALANIYPQLNPDPTIPYYKCKVIVKGRIKETYTVADNNPAPGLTYSTDLPVATETPFCRSFEMDLTCPASRTVSDATATGTQIIEVELDQSFADYNPIRFGHLDAMDISCTIEDVLVILHPLKKRNGDDVEDADADAVSDIAFFHNTAAEAADYEAEKDMVAVTAAAAIGTMGITDLNAFSANEQTSHGWLLYGLANDPRCNDRADAWNLANLATADKTTPSTFALAVPAWNNIVTECGVSSADGDKDVKDWEPDLDVISAVDTATNTFSTAFIANEPFTSLWQLGAIHRYGVGQTINLRAYNHDLTVGKYEDGDAALLDFLKVTEAENGILGKFNPNCFNEGAYKYLLKDIPDTDDVNDVWIYRPIAGNTTLAEADLNRVSFGAGDLYKDQSWLPVQAFMTYCKPSYTDCSDREIEAFFGCTAGLLSTRYETFTVITVGQSLQYLENLGDEKDVDDNPIGAGLTDKADVEKLGGVNPVQINGRWYSTQGTCVQLVTVLRDCWLNTFKIVNRQRL